MPAHPSPLLAKPPKRRPPEWTNAQWAFPERLVDLAAEQRWTRKQIQKHAGVSQATVSRWLTYKAQQPDVTALKKLEKAAGKPIGWLLRDDDGADGPASVDSAQLAARLLRLGLSGELTALSDEELGVVEKFRPEVRKAILGIVHVFDVPLERAAAIARDVVAKHHDMVGSPSGDAPFWFDRMARRVPELPESGSFPSSGSIKIPKK